MSAQERCPSLGSASILAGRIEDPEALFVRSLFPGSYAAQAAAYYALRCESDTLSSFRIAFCLRLSNPSRIYASPA